MNFKPLLIITLATSTLFCQLSYALQNTMTFKNERGSVLEFSILADNKIEGYFITAVASKTCPQAIGKKRPIIGYTIDNVMTFSVVYPMCGSVLVTTGNFSKDKKMIDTLSILNRKAEDVTHQGPDSRFIGHDTYRKTEFNRSYA